METNDELVGQKLEGQRDHYRLLQLLGAGLTARVYRGEAVMETGEPTPVAVKIMRPGLGREEQQRFRDEAGHLAKLLSLKAEAAPVYYENFTTGDPEVPEVLVLELMTGQKVEDLLANEGPLPERDGLSLGLQLAKLLQALHENMQRTYTDLKFENLWWQQDGGKLKVTDWNVLGEFGQLGRVPVDLLRASRYTYTVLTGAEAREQGGVVVTDFLREPRFQSLSVATQNILRKAMHRNPDLRFKSAAELAEALQKALRSWELAPSRVLETAAVTAVVMMGDQYQKKAYDQALEPLDTLRRRRDSGDPGFSAADRNSLDGLWNKVDARLKQEQTLLESGIELFVGNSYRKANEQFTRAQEDDPWDMANWRWRAAARAGLATTGFERHTGEVKQAVEALNNNEFARAERILERINLGALAGVLNEARTRRLKAEGERLAAEGQQLTDAGLGDSEEADTTFNQAQAAYGKAADALNSITPDDYRKQVSDELGDLAEEGRKLVDERRSDAALAGRNLRTAETKYRAGDYSAALIDLTAGLEAVPREQRLVAASLSYGQERFLAGSAATATGFLSLAARYAGADSPARGWALAAVNAGEVAALLDEDSWEAALTRATQTLALPAPDEAKPGMAAVMRPALQRALDRPASAPDLAVLRDLVDRSQDLAQLDPSFQLWADQASQQWPSLAAAWLAVWSPDRGGVVDLKPAPEGQAPQQPAEWDRRRFADQVDQALKLTPVGIQQANLAAQVQPKVRTLLQQSAGWWRTPGIQALAQTAHKLLDLAPRTLDAGWLGQEVGRLVSADVTAAINDDQPALALDRAREAVSQAPDDLKDAVAQSVQPAVSQLLAAVPPDVNLTQAREVAMGAEALLLASAALKASPWSVQVRQYQTTQEREEQRRRSMALEQVQQYTLGLMRTDDPASLEQARGALNQALQLTPADTAEYAQIKGLERQLEQREEDSRSVGDRQRQIQQVLAAFDDRLGAARTDADFEDIGQELVDTRRQAERIKDTALMTSCSVKERTLKTTLANRPKTLETETQLAGLQEQIASLNAMAAVPGIKVAQNSLWEQVAAVAATLLLLHPEHSAAVQAQRDVAAYRDRLGLTERLAMADQLTTDLGAPLRDMERAQLYYQSAQPDQAQQLIAGLPDDWKRSQRVDTLAQQVAQGSQFLADAKALGQADVLDAGFDDRLDALLRTSIPAGYLAASGLADQLKDRRLRLLRQVAADTRPSAKRTPQALATLVALDQDWRIASAVQAGQRPVRTSGDPGVSQFVEQALNITPEKGNDAAGQLDGLVQSLPLVERPAQVAGVIRKETEDALAVAGQVRKSKVGRLIAAIVAGVLLLGALVAVAGFIMPGFLPGSLPNTQATATAYAAQPLVTVVTQVVTATPLPPTATPVPATATPLPAAVVTPTQTVVLPPVAAYQQPDRLAAALAGINAGAVITTGESVSNTFAISDVVAMVDDGDLLVEAATPLTSTTSITEAAGITATETLTPTEPTFLRDLTIGQLGGMSYLGTVQAGQAAATPVFAWEAIGPVAPGAYRVYGYFPAGHGTGEASYSVEWIPQDGGPKSLLTMEEKVTSKLIDQAKYDDQWVELGTVRVLRPGTLQIKATPGQPKDAKTEWAFDAMAFVKAP